MKKLFKSEQSGRSMVEMLGVLAIIGVLSVGGIAGYSKAMAKYKLTKTIDQISMLTANIRTAFASSSSYEGLTTENARAWGLASSDMYSSTDGELINPFLGKIEVVAAQGNGIDNMGFAVQYTMLPREACVNLATADWGVAGFTGITVTAPGEGETDVEAIEANSDANQKPDDAATAKIKFATAAALCTNETANAVAIYFY